MHSLAQEPFLFITGQGFLIEILISKYTRYCLYARKSTESDEKFKHHKNRNVYRYVYYTCTKTKNIHCDAGYMNEKDLIKQLKNIIDDIDIKALPMKDKIKHEVERYKKFQNMLLENQPKIIVKNIDLKNYAKFVLQEGSIGEQQELISCLKGEIFVNRKEVYLRD